MLLGRAVVHVDKEETSFMNVARNGKVDKPGHEVLTTMSNTCIRGKIWQKKTLG